MRVFKATGLRYRISIVSGGGGGLHFKWNQGEAAGVGNQYNCVGFPTTFGRHCCLLRWEIILILLLKYFVVPKLLNYVNTSSFFKLAIPLA